MGTNELAAKVQAGEMGYLPLWAAVRWFAHDRAYRWASLNSVGGVTVEDLDQCAFLALMETVESWGAGRGGFLTLYGLKLRTAFLEAAGLRTQRDRQDPLRTAVSLDAPLVNEDGDADATLADVLEDPSAAAEIDDVVERDFRERRREALAAALATLPADQRVAVVGRCCYGKKTDRRAYNAGLKVLRRPDISRPLMEFL